MKKQQHCRYINICSSSRTTTKVLHSKVPLTKISTDLLYEAKLIKTSAVGCAAQDASMLQQLSISRLDNLKITNKNGKHHLTNITTDQPYIDAHIEMKYRKN